MQAQLKEKAPPRRHPKNEPQAAILRGLLTDREGRPMVPTYGSKKTRRYAYYETRKDLARPGSPPAVRVQQGLLEQHVIGYLDQLLNDEHALRRLSGSDEAIQLRTMFAAGQQLAVQLRDLNGAEAALRSLVESVTFRVDQLEIILRPKAIGLDAVGNLQWSIPLPRRLPFREAKIRIDSERRQNASDRQLLALLADAVEVQRLVLASPGLSMNQIAKQAGRCRTQLTRLLRISWLSPKIIDAITSGTQPKSVDRRFLLAADIPVAWAEQERAFGFSR